jgi:adenylate kinase
MRQLVRDWLASVPPERGFVLDGYPRSLNQAYDCERILADLQLRLDLAIGLVLARQEIFRRLAGRRICAGGGGEAFSLHLDDAAAVRRCQERGGQLIQRDDDRPEVIEERLRVYEHETRPVLEFYARRGLLAPHAGWGRRI